MGYAGMLLAQVGVNVAMCLYIFPVVGLTLPFISYGGSSIITLFAAIIITLILRLTVYQDSAFLTHLSSLLLGLACGALFYIRKYKHTQKTSALYSIITIVLVVMCVLYVTFGTLGLLGFLD